MTLCIPYYNAPEMLKEQLRHWRTYPSVVTIILVDDGSPMYSAWEALQEYDFRKGLSATLKVFRIKDNVRWNISGALNLAFTHARDGWCVSGAIDHVLSGKDVRWLIQEAVLHPSKYYRFPRVDVGANGLQIPRMGYGNLFLLTRELFWRVGGYDEDFAGFYGGVGNAFRRQLNRLAEERVLEDVHWLHYETLDGQVTDWDRNEISVQNHPVMKQKLTRARNKYSPVNPLRFNWEQIL